MSTTRSCTIPFTNGNISVNIDITGEFVEDDKFGLAMDDAFRSTIEAIIKLVPILNHTMNNDMLHVGESRHTSTPITIDVLNHTVVVSFDITTSREIPGDLLDAMCVHFLMPKTIDEIVEKASLYTMQALETEHGVTIGGQTMNNIRDLLEGLAGGLDLNPMGDDLDGGFGLQPNTLGAGYV